MTIHRLQQLDVKWASEVYTVSEDTIDRDSQRTCWICSSDFKLGDGMTIVNTGHGKNKVMHSRCYQSQQEAT